MTKEKLNEQIQELEDAKTALKAENVQLKEECKSYLQEIFTLRVSVVNIKKSLAEEVNLAANNLAKTWGLTFEQGKSSNA